MGVERFRFLNFGKCPGIQQQQPTKLLGMMLLFGFLFACVSTCIYAPQLLFCCCDQIPPTEAAQEKRVDLRSQFKVQFIMVRESRRQELKPAVPNAPTVRKKGVMNASVDLAGFTIQHPSPGNGGTYNL